MNTSTLRPFRPARGLSNPHAQTIWPSVLRRRPSLALRRQVWERPPAPDGKPNGSIDIVTMPARSGRPGVLLLHGLEGSARSPYMLGMMAALTEAGWNGAILEFRSCGPTPPQVPQLYHSGKTDEIAFALQELERRWQAPLAAVGFSLGGNALLKFLGEDAPPLRAAVAISVPFDLDACARSLDGAGFFSRLYRGHFLRSLKRKACETALRHQVPFTVEQVRRCQTLRAFDHLVTAPLFGFASAEDYYARNSSGRFLSGIRVPTRLIASRDDPFIPESAIPLASIRANPALDLRLFSSGGHVGFVSGGIRSLRYEAEPEAVAHLRRFLD